MNEFPYKSRKWLKEHGFKKIRGQNHYEKDTGPFTLKVRLHPMSGVYELEVETRGLLVTGRDGDIPSAMKDSIRKLDELSESARRTADEMRKEIK